MTVNEFFRKFPIPKTEISRMLGCPSQYLALRTYKDRQLSDYSLKMVNEAIQELAWQLKQVVVTNEWTFQAECMVCHRKFIAHDSGKRADFYTVHGLHCDDCIANFNKQ